MDFKKKHQLAVLALVVSSIIWGAAPPILKWSMQSIEPFTLAFLRFVIASLLLLPFLLRNNHKHLSIDPNDVKKFVLLGICGVSLHIGFFFIGLSMTNSINAHVIGSSTPIFLLLLAIVVLRERVKKNIIYGTLISLSGILLIVLQPVFAHGIDSHVLGNLFYVISTISFIPYTFMLKEITKKYDYIVILFWTFLIGAMSFLPFAYTEMQKHSITEVLNAQSLIGILYSALFASVIAYLCYSYGVRNLLTNEVGVFMYINPIVSVIVAVPLLGETITPIFIVGTVLVFLGIYLSEGHRHHHPHHLHKFR
jgi:drug/metabolite transporter (DMT)-like permease